MILCNNYCTPCCDFCIYAKRNMYLDYDGNPIYGEPIGCELHDDEEHELIAVSCGYCDDFHCFRA